MSHTHDVRVHAYTHEYDTEVRRISYLPGHEDSYTCHETITAYAVNAPGDTWTTKGGDTKEYRAEEWLVEGKLSIYSRAHLEAVIGLLEKLREEGWDE